MLSRIQNLFRGCLLSYGVSNRNGVAAVQPVIPPSAVTTYQTTEDQLADADDQLIAWEHDRAATLQDADQSEQQGLRHLTRAALLRLVVQFEDDGLFVVAHELRQQADQLDQAVLVEQSFATPPF